MSDQQNEWNQAEEPKTGGEEINKAMNSAASQFDTAAAAEVWDTGAPVGQPDAARPAPVPEIIDVQPNVSGFERPEIHTEAIPPMGSAEPPKKGRLAGWIIALIVLVVLCCCLMTVLIVAAVAGAFGDVFEVTLPLAALSRVI